MRGAPRGRPYWAGPRLGAARGAALTRAALCNMITTRVLGFVGLGVSTVGQTLGGRARWSLVPSGDGGL